MKRLLSSVAVTVLVMLSASCRREAPAARVMTLYNAGSLAVPLRAVADTFARREGVRVEQENAGSVETARKLTDLGHIPDVIALADVDLFPRFLVPRYVASYTPFARNRVVLAFTKKSRYASEITADNWYEIVSRPGVEVGRSDPRLDPAGYRALLVFKLAERFYTRPKLAERLEAAAPARNMRPKSADLTALLQTAHLDYAWEYESVARATGVQFVTLPSQIDLSTVADSAYYAAASVRIPGLEADSGLVRGAPIVFAVAQPRTAPHGDIGARFITFLLSPEGRSILRAHQLDALEPAREADTR